MADNSVGRIAELLEKCETQLLDEWMAEQAAAAATGAGGQTARAGLREQAAEFLRLLRQATRTGSLSNIAQGAEWSALRDMLGSLSRSWAIQGHAPSETAMFVFSLKQPLFKCLRDEIKDTDALFEGIWQATRLLDQLGLYTTEVYLRSREDTILRQQETMLELSTPVVKLWDGILALPLIGTLDSARTQVVMESLLQAIVETGSEVAIIDITGVPTVDTLVSQHLLKTVAAARLMGADCIISGIRPQIAQTIVHLGVDLSMVTTKASLADAFVLALQRTGRSLSGIDGLRPAPGAPRRA
jgi:rsbT co-antagonist protein RsbR